MLDLGKVLNGLGIEWAVIARKDGEPWREYHSGDVVMMRAVFHEKRRWAGEVSGDYGHGVRTERGSDDGVPDVVQWFGGWHGAFMWRPHEMMDERDIARTEELIEAFFALHLAAEGRLL